MPIPRITDLEPHQPRHGAGSRMFAEWCFFKVCVRHMRWRLAVMVLILLAGALLFRLFEPEKEHSLAQAMYYTFSLVFAEQPEDFPKSIVLQAVFFLVPILGLTVIIEGIVDLSLMLRDRRKFERSWCTMLADSFSDHIVLVGLGRLGSRIFQTLRRLGLPVVVIERNADNQFLEEVRRDGSPLFIGDGRDETFLADANVKAARSVVVATDDDFANLEIALDARKLNPDVRVVVRMFDQAIADKIAAGFNIHLAMSPSALSAPAFASCAMAPATVNSFIVGDRLLAMQRWLVRRGGPLCGMTVADAMRAHGVGVVEHRRAPGKPSLCPSPDLVLEAGDGIMVQGTIEALEGLRTAQAVDMDATAAAAMHGAPTSG